MTQPTTDGGSDDAVTTAGSFDIDTAAGGDWTDGLGTGQPPLTFDEEETGDDE